MIHLFDVFLFCKSIPDDDETNLDANGQKVNCFFSLSLYINCYLFIIITNYVFLLGYSKSIIFTSINNLDLLAFYGHRDCNAIKRLFLNLFSGRFIIKICLKIINC